MLAQLREKIDRITRLNKTGEVFTIDEMMTIAEQLESLVNIISEAYSLSKQASMALLDHDLALARERLRDIARLCGEQLEPMEG
jgi:hypothetical protein